MRRWSLSNRHRRHHRQSTSTSTSTYNASYFAFVLFVQLGGLGRTLRQRLLRLFLVIFCSRRLWGWGKLETSESADRQPASFPAPPNFSQPCACHYRPATRNCRGHRTPLEGTLYWFFRDRIASFLPKWSRSPITTHLVDVSSVGSKSRQHINPEPPSGW